MSLRHTSHPSHFPLLNPKWLKSPPFINPNILRRVVTLNLVNPPPCESCSINPNGTKDRRPIHYNLLTFFRPKYRICWSKEWSWLMGKINLLLMLHFIEPLNRLWPFRRNEPQWLLFFVTSTECLVTIDLEIRKVESFPRRASLQPNCKPLIPSNLWHDWHLILAHEKRAKCLRHWASEGRKSYLMGWD